MKPWLWGICECKSGNCNNLRESSFADFVLLEGNLNFSKVTDTLRKVAHAVACETDGKIEIRSNRGELSQGYQALITAVFASVTERFESIPNPCNIGKCRAEPSNSSRSVEKCRKASSQSTNLPSGWTGWQIAKCQWGNSWQLSSP